MKFVNQHDLPAPMFEALTWDTYTKGDSDFSTTELLKSPRARLLAKRHEDEIVVDASENLWVLMGRAVHDVLEKACKRLGAKFDGMSEERLFLKIKLPDGREVTISGEFDLLYRDGESLVLADYKVTGCYGLIMEKKRGFVKLDWEIQLNIYRWLLHKHGFEVDRLEIGAILRDWMESKVGTEDYPVSPIVVLPVKVWTFEETEAFVLERLKLHMDAKETEDDYLPSCTAEERWERGEKWAVMEKGKKRANKLCDSAKDAEYFVKEIGKTAYVEHRAGQSIKCQRYCYGMPFCSQAKALGIGVGTEAVEA